MEKNDLTKINQSLKCAMLIVVFSLGACSFMPNSGPYSKKMKEESSVHITEADVQWVGEPQKNQYLLIDINAGVIAQLANALTVSKSTVWPQSDSKKPVTINIGDTLQVTIFEAQSGGLFIPREAGVRAGNFVTVPSQLVDYTGKITVPFAGEVLVLNRTPAAVSEEITEKLIKRAIEPQVVVSIVGRSSAAVTVLGDVKENTRLALNLDGDRILDAIARVGGLSYPDFQTYLAFRRDNREWTIRFDELVRDPQKNIFLRSQDTLYLYREADRYQVYGASGINSSFDFVSRHMSLSEALGSAGGLNQNFADPEEIYLFRMERTSAIKQLAASSEFRSALGNADLVPVIYKLNLREAKGFFLARNFSLQNQDILYLANAESVEFLRFLNILDATAVTTVNTRAATQ